MQIEQRIKAFTLLGEFLNGFHSEPSRPEFEELNNAIQLAERNNAWFTKENIIDSLDAVASFLNEKSLTEWLSKYSLQNEARKRVGVIMAGNIPMVGFHDMMCVLLSGSIFIGKLSSSDAYLIPALTKKIIEFEPEFKDRIILTEKLKDFDAVIATGSNNTARYFEYYFGKYPHIIRKNRNSIAVLNGKETQEELKSLGKDIFQYFGLGCRNVSKLYVPQGFDFTHLLDAFNQYADIAKSSKYFNNYEYHKAIYLVNRVPHLDTGFLLVKEDSSLHSPIAVLHYEVYSDEKSLREDILSKEQEIQCVVTSQTLDLPGMDIQKFGNAQCPAVSDYADRVDTMEFLKKLNDWSLVYKPY